MQLPKKTKFKVGEVIFPFPYSDNLEIVIAVTDYTITTCCTSKEEDYKIAIIPRTQDELDKKGYMLVEETAWGKLDRKNREHRENKSTPGMQGDKDLTPLVYIVRSSPFSCYIVENFSQTIEKEELKYLRSIRTIFNSRQEAEDRLREIQNS